MGLRLVVAVLGAVVWLAAFQADQDLASVRMLELDAERCYRVRDVFLEREDVKLYFTDGHLIFAKPVLGRVIAALFVATRSTDLGEVLLIPPTAAERQSAARFLGETILTEKFRSAMLFFTDDTHEALEAALAASPGTRPDLGEGARIAPRWSVVMRNLIDGSSSRVLVDLYSGTDGDTGFFASAIRGAKHGRFDVVVDRSLPEQVVAGQMVRYGGREVYETWLRFESRSSRLSRWSPRPASARLDRYRIQTRLGTDLHMQVRAEAALVLMGRGQPALAFEISNRLEVTAVRVNGSDVDFLQQQRPSRGPQTRPEDVLVVVLLPPGLAAPGEHTIAFEYQGRVVSEAGQGVYYVGDRGNWYPRLGIEDAVFDLSFRYPAGLELVATGTRVDDALDEGMRVSRFTSGKPIRIAGFNLGDFASAVREVDGFRIEVRANKTVEERLQPPRTPVLLPPSVVSSRRRNRNEQPVLVLPATPVASPAEDIERVADESAEAFRYFRSRFGDPAMPVTVISPVPGGFGQGFPGLVFASTLSYFERGDQPLSGLAEDAQRFFVDLMRPHEIAHQWWGNVVNSILERDGWIMEALATYSSILWLEHQSGIPERNSVLAEFRTNLMRKVDGESIESSGPIVLGRRLRTAKLPYAHRVIVYEKGAWIIHMLRGIVGDEAFFKMLRQLCVRFAGEPVTTEAFRALVAESVPDGHRDPELRDFFDQWVYGTGIPRLRVRWDQSERGGRHQFEMRVSQSGVDDYFPMEVPVEVHTLPTRSLVKTVTVGEDEDEVRVPIVLRNPASSVQIDPEGWLLADVQR
ncbi:MAG: M1 family aminopeptidase [Bryobacterales bacterium]|nr:M1 family aminopeptidase [Bryobacterales bacterium]